MKQKEFWTRLKDFGLLGSVARDRILELQIAYSRSPYSEIHRLVRPYTVCGSRRLKALYEAVQYTEKQGIAGDFVECGVAKGGSAALIALASKRLGGKRTIWLFDTFEGIPHPSQENPDIQIAELYTASFRVEVAEIRSLFERLEIAARTNFVKGMVEDTLPTCQIGSIALLHIDTDWYESVKACLENLYDRVSLGGVIQIDDYGYWKGARKAVDAFLKKRDIKSPLRVIDYSGRQIVKE